MGWIILIIILLVLIPIYFLILRAKEEYLWMLKK